MKTNFITLALVFLACPLFPQDAPDHMGMHADNMTVLHPEEKVVIPTESNRPIYQPARCDADGNVYFRGYQSDDRRVPITRVDGKGGTLKYSLDSDPTLSQGASYDFSLLPNGNLYQPVQVKEDVFIVAFSRDSNIRWKAKLDQQFWVAHLTALSDKSFLVSGTEPQTPSQRQERQPPRLFLALFDDHGHMVRRISLQSDDPSNPAPAQKNYTAKNDPTKEMPFLPVLEGDAQTDVNGYVYLALRSNPVVIYVLDPSGQTVRSFPVNPPEPRMSFSSMGLAKDRLAISFREIFRGMEHHNMAIVTVNASTGAVIGRYSVEAEPGTVLACHTPNQFLFIGSDKSNLAIFHASLK
ncbi:MAG TPA: hypothetical protein VK738_00445 [Terriglobales bacterium]|jgi:hypothetical protein|nr:hypothetical protein [Terriglobales bacterium]